MGQENIEVPALDDGDELGPLTFLIKSRKQVEEACLVTISVHRDKSLGRLKYQN